MRSRGTRHALSINNSGQSITLVSVLLVGCILGFSISRSLQQPSNTQSQCLCHDILCPSPTVPPHAIDTWADTAHKASSLQQEVLSGGTAAQPSTESNKESLQTKFSRLPRLTEIPAGSDVFLTFSNGHYSKLMLNAASLVADLGFPIVVLTFDQAAEDTCTDYNIPFMRSSVQMDTADFRQDRSKFLLMGSEKPKAVLRLFKEIGVQTVVLTDTDTIWLRDPFPFFGQHPQADMFVTTDCLSHEVEVHNILHTPRCGHVEGGLGIGWALNTGVTVWRNTNATQQFATQWGEFMDNNELHQRGVDDQFSFNQLVTSDFDPRSPKTTDQTSNQLVTLSTPLKRVDGDPKVFYAAPGQSLKLMVLPSALFAGGKTMFYSHLPEAYGLTPYVVHSTFQRYNNAGKVARFREAGAYVLDDPEYFTEGNFLVYDNLVLEYMEAIERLVHGNLTQVHKHLLAAEYQLSAFRDAAAAARTLNRTLILPKLWAWCDSDQPTIMQHCSMEGAQQVAPWQAPTDLYVNMDTLEREPDFLQWRTHNFLSDPRTPRTLTWSQSSIWYNFPGSVVPKVYATGAQIHQVSAEILRQATQDIDARVLRVQNLQPGMFGSLDTTRENEEFNGWFSRMMFDMKWCCTTNVQGLRESKLNALFFSGPSPLPVLQASGYKVPVFEHPSYCRDPEVMSQIQQEPWKPLAYGMHPCNFLAPSRVPTLPEWGPDLWQVMTDIRESHRWRTWESSWQR